VKADYKHKTQSSKAQSKNFAPSLLRLLFFSCLAVLFSWGWYQQQTKTKSNQTDLEVSELAGEEGTIYTEYTEEVPDIESTLDLVAMAPLEPLQDTPVLTSEENEATNHELTEQKSIAKLEATNSIEFTIKPGKNLSFYLNQEGLSAKTIHNLLNVAHKRHLIKVYPGQVFKLKFDENGKFNALSLRLSAAKSIEVKEVNKGKYISELIEKPIEARTTMTGAEIQDSLYLAGKKANISDNMIMELADIFAYDIDFALDIRPNDQFKVVYQEYYVEGEKVENGPILAAEFVNQKKRFVAIRHQEQNGKYSYFTPDGKSLKKAFIRTPVEYTRISSHFNLKRRHPVLHHIRAHKGVDYAAPTGTPVKAAGDGKVDFIGKKGGYGNVIILQHGTKYSTLYAHLHKFHHKLKKGSTVSQNQTIAYVGKSGLATGPHLHYEFRINDVHHNPLTVALPQAEPLNSKERKVLMAKANEYMHLIELQENIMLARNEEQKSKK
jgi:murein DD-endopeptidase MepM/ murein hydrolase activator NlpD